MLTFLVLTFWEPPSRITICSFIVPDPEGLCELWPSSQRMVYHDMMSILPQYKTIPDNPFSHDSTVCKHIIHDWYVHIGPYMYNLQVMNYKPAGPNCTVPLSSQLFAYCTFFMLSVKQEERHTNKLAAIIASKWETQQHGERARVPLSVLANLWNMLTDLSLIVSTKICLPVSSAN